MSDDAGSGLSPGEARTLSTALDAIIPPSEDGRLPGAGELGLGRSIAPLVAGAPELRAGLAALDDAARRRGVGEFSDMPAADRPDALGAVAAEQPSFLHALIFHTFAGYYQHARVLAALGLEPRPPFPDGYELEPGDLSLLDAVRRRPPMYRRDR